MTPDYEQPVADYPRFHAARTPDDVAYIDRGAICTYAQLDKRSNQVANGIIGAGCRPGDRLAYLGINSGAYVETFFAANKAKVVYVGVNWRLTPVELDYILNDAGSQTHLLRCAVHAYAGNPARKSSVYRENYQCRRIGLCRMARRLLRGRSAKRACTAGCNSAGLYPAERPESPKVW